MVFGTLNEVYNGDLNENARIEYPVPIGSPNHDDITNSYRILHHLNNEKETDPINNHYLRQMNTEFHSKIRNDDQKDMSTLEKLFAMVKNAVYKGRNFVAALIDRFYVWLQKIQNKINKEKAQGNKGIWLTIKDNIVSAIRWLTTKLHNFIQKDRGEIYNDYNKLELSDKEKNLYNNRQLDYDSTSAWNNINIAVNQHFS